MKRRWIFLLLILFSSLYGCAHYVGDESTQAVVMTSEAFKLFEGEYENTAYFRTHKPKSIAVLPFKDMEKKAASIDFDVERPADIVRRGLYNHISSLPFSDLEIFEVDTRLKNAGMPDVPSILQTLREDPGKLKSILGVDAVVTGEVTHFDRIFLGIYSQVAVGCEVKMWDLNTGKLLWRAKHVSRAHAGGFSLNPIGLIMSTVASVWNLRQTELFSQTDALFREIVSTIEIPETALALRKKQPKIDLFAVMNSGKPYTLGKRVSFRIIGDPGCKAYVDLGDFKVHIPLEPVSGEVKEALKKEVLEAVTKNYEKAGYKLTPELLDAVKRGLEGRQIYEGSYTVEPGEQSYGLTAKCYLVDSSGMMSSQIDPAHLIHIDSRPPEKIGNIETFSYDRKIQLKWPRSSEEDIAYYEVLLSGSPISGYRLAKKSEENRLNIDGLENFERVYLKVRAVDRAGNKGDLSSYKEAVPLPEPDLYDLEQPGPSLGGEIRERVLLVADKGPFNVFSDLRILSGGILYVEPGTQILFAPGTSMEVNRGRVMVYGRPDKPVFFGALGESRGPGSWKGIRLKDAGGCLFKNALIKYAEIGMEITGSGPTINGSLIQGSSMAGLVLKENARPKITCSVFKDNEGQGGIVIEGEGVAPVIRENAFLNNSPFQVQSYAPVQIDLTQNYWGGAPALSEWFLGEIKYSPELETSPSDCVMP